MEIVGNVNITGAYNINNRNVIADTSNYILSTSNILVGRINASGGGSGTLTSGGNLTLSNNATSNTVLSIANSNVVYGTIQGTSNYTSNYTSNVVTTGSFIATFADANVPSTHAQVTSSTDRYMIFTTASVNHTFTVPTGGLNCDILMIGGGGGAFAGGSCAGGGAGACIVAINQTLPAGSCVVNVGVGGTSSANSTNGGDSFIQVANTDRYRAKGGGAGGGNSGDLPGLNGGCGGGASYNFNTITDNGGQPVITNVITLNNSLTSNIGPCLSSNFAVLGNAGGNNGTVNGKSGSGGGIGASGITGGTGGDGAYQITLKGASTPINFRNYFANGSTSFGVQDGSTGNYYIGGGGGGYKDVPSPTVFYNGGLGGGGGGAAAAFSNTGGGGGSITTTGLGSAGGSGIIIIRYRIDTTTTTPTPLSIPESTPITIPTTTFGVPTIELIRGISGDTNTDYKLGNYDGNFKIMSSISSIDTDRLSIINAGNIGIGTIPVSDTNKLQVQGNVNVSGGYFVAGTAFKPATAVLADTATKLATSRTIASVGFDGTAAIDIPYFNLTNKITAGNGISLTTGSAVASPSISTNLTAGNGITISAAASPVIASSQWITTGANIYYNSGNVGIGTATVNNILQVGSGGRLRIANGATDYTLIGTSDVDANGVTKIILSGVSRSGDEGRIGYISSSTGSHVFYTEGATERLRITSTGNVGIGNNAPGFRLEVSGSTSAGTMFATYFGYNNYIPNHGGLYDLICAKFNGAIWTTQYLAVSSDIRIKEDIQDIIDDTALKSILTIEPKTYKYIDKLQRGDKKVYGFIAQQIREVIPEAVSIQASYIPNIYLVADYIENVITLSSQPTKVIIKMNDKIKCYDKDNKEILVEVIEVIDGLTFRIKEIEYIDNKIFVYGTFVDDFHTLNKDYIFTLNVCATQELHRRIEAQSVLLKSQDDRIKDLEMKVAMLLNSNAT